MARNINWNLYKYFIAVYETKNYHRASELLGVSPSAVLQNIKELSNQLGAVLFNSKNRGVEPTNEADELYPQMKKAVNLISATENKFEKFDNESTGVIKIATNSWFAKIYLNNYLKKFCSAYPKVQLEIIQSEDISLLKQKKLDCIIDIDSLFYGTDFKTIDMLGKELEYSFVASREYTKIHGLDKPITKTELSKRPIIERSVSWTNYRNKWLGADFTPLEIKIQTAEQAISMLKNSIGIACFNNLILKDLNDPDIVKLQIKDLLLPRGKLVCAYVNLTRPAKTFIDGLLKFCNG